MKISYKWLNLYLDIDLSPEELQNRMTFAGLEVEGVEKIGENLNQYLVAEIIKCETHPDSDHLSICQVNNGSDIKQVICGAPNCANGQKVVFAPVGASIGDFKITKVKLRGKESFGMICSEKELGISDNHDGILVLPDDAPIGDKLGTYLQKDDLAFEVEITPNRPDLLGIFGVARDLAAILKVPLKRPSIKINETGEHIKSKLKLQNDAPDLCTRYTARMIKGVTIKESPTWLKQRLNSVGLRPINNIVDITNFVMMEFGHPLHAFDYCLIKDKTIIVRRAKEGEKFPALDEETYTLKKNDLVIADATKPIAIAGVIGGGNSHITKETKDVVIEAANFLYSSIRRTSSRLKISTDSSYRFERDIADETAELVSQRTCQLILELAGGELLKGKLDSYPNPVEKRIVGLRPSRVKKLLTITVSNKQIINYLEPLGLRLSEQETDLLKFEIPSYRKDLAREIDLIEEIIRLHGYNSVESFIKSQKIMDKSTFYTRRKVKYILVSNGFSEVINWNFGDPADLDKLNIPTDDERRNNAKLKNPLGSSFSIMRSMLIPQLLKNALFNIHHGQKNLKIFEQAKVFTRYNEKLATEKLHLSALITGALHPVYWKEDQHPVDFYDVKSIVEEILDVLCLSAPIFKVSSEKFYQPKLAVDVFLKERMIGSFGKIDSKIAGKYDIEQPLFILDIKLQDIYKLQKSMKPIFHDIPKFPPVLRDLSFVISKKYSYNEIMNSIYSINKKLITKAELFDEYIGKNIKDGYRSLTFSLIFSSDTKTLTDDYINNILQKIIEKLKSDFNIEMR